MATGRQVILFAICVATLPPVLSPPVAFAQAASRGVGIEKIRTITADALNVGHIAAIAADGDGRLYVLDSWPGSEQLVMLGPDGRRVRLAGTGQGPGEIIEPIHSLPWKGDTLFVLDREQRRITGFLRGDATAHTSSWSSRAPFPFVAHGSSTYLLGVNVASGDQIRVTYTRLASDGMASELPALTDQVGANSHVPCSTANREEMQGYNTPFRDPLPLLTVLPNGTVARSRPGENRISFINPATGSVLRSFEVQAPTTRLRPNDWHRTTEGAWVRQAERDGGGPLLDFPARTKRCELYEMLPEVAPPIFSIQSDEAGRVWVETVAPTISAGLTLVAYTEQGAELGRVSMPERDARANYVIRGSRLYLVAADQLGLQSIEVYQLTVPSSLDKH